MKKWIASNRDVRKHRICGVRRVFERRWRLGVFTAPKTVGRELKCIYVVRSERGGENTCLITTSEARLAIRCRSTEGET